MGSSDDWERQFATFLNGLKLIPRFGHPTDMTRPSSGLPSRSPPSRKSSRLTSSIPSSSDLYLRILSAYIKLVGSAPWFLAASDSVLNIVRTKFSRLLLRRLRGLREWFWAGQSALRLITLAATAPWLLPRPPLGTHHHINRLHGRCCHAMRRI